MTMNEIVNVQLPVSREAADALKDDARREKIGKLVSDLLRPTSPAEDPLAALIATLKQEVRRDGLSDDAIDAELAAYNGERRL
jgi:hypothetical protein